MTSDPRGSCDVEAGGGSSHSRARRERCARCLARWAQTTRSDGNDRLLGPVQVRNQPLEAVRRWPPGLFCPRKHATRLSIWGMWDDLTVIDGEPEAVSPDRALIEAL